MATLQRAAPTGDSAWDFVRHFANVAYESAGAFLSGTYVYTFSNSTEHAVKLHLVDARAVGSQPAAYFLAMPKSRSVEVPMPSDMVRVTAGFFRPELEDYEVFWEGRPFAWEAGCTISVAPRHSSPSNAIRSDVFPGAPAVERAPAQGKALAVRPMRLFVDGEGGAGRPGAPSAGRPMAPSIDLPGLVIFTQRKGVWVQGRVVRELVDGTLELEEGSERWSVRPQEQLSLAPAPAFAASLPCDPSSLGRAGGTMEAEAPREATITSASGSLPGAPQTDTMATNVTMVRGGDMTASQASGGTMLRGAQSDTLATDASVVRSLASSAPSADGAGAELQKTPSYAPQLMASAHPPSATLPPASAQGTLRPMRSPAAARGTL